MTEKSIGVATILPSWLRNVLGGICVVLVLLVLACAISVPFVFESQSIRYKFGFDKTLLRTGKIIGMICATLLLLQLILSARFKLLDHIFALNRLYIFHRINAVIIAVLVVFHPLFVYAPEDITTLKFDLESWPMVLGAALLLTIWTITATGLWRTFLDLPFNLWWLAHRVATCAAAVMLFVHVLYVSDTFEAGLPRLIVLLIASIYALIFCWVKLKPFLLKRKPYEITHIAKTAKDTYSIDLSPQARRIFKYFPGQFAFLSPQSKNLPAEEHPFTISSSPTRSENIQFSIHCSGDWTSRIGHLKPGHKIILDGPYGQFSHLAHDNHKELIMIGGGIGITPILSMLRYMADINDKRQVTIVWSNRTKADRVFGDEFDTLEQQLEKLRIFHVYTREHGKKGVSARLDKSSLETLLKDCDRKAAIFICGPPLMMEKVQQILPQIGFSKRLIYTEKFSL